MNKKIIMLFCGVSILASSTTHAMERFRSWFSRSNATNTAASNTTASTEAPFNTAALAEFVGRYKLPYTTSEEQETTKAFFILIQKMNATHFTEEEQTRCEDTYLSDIRPEIHPIFIRARQKYQSFKNAAQQALTITLNHHEYTQAFLDTLSAAIPSMHMRMSNGDIIGLRVIQTILDCLTEISKDRLSIAIKAIPIAKAINDWHKLEVNYLVKDFGIAMYQSFLPRHTSAMGLRNEDLDELLKRLETLQRRFTWIGMVMRATHGQLPLSTHSFLPAITDEEYGADGVEESKDGMEESKGDE